MLNWKIVSGSSLAFLTVFGLSCCTYLSSKPETQNREPQSLAQSPVQVSVFFGSDVVPVVRERVKSLLTSTGLSLNTTGCTADNNSDQLELHFGNTSATLISPSEKNSLKSDEGFIIKSQFKPGTRCLQIAVDSKAGDLQNLRKTRGVSYGIYAVLQDMGFKFLHPLKPETQFAELNLDKLKNISRTENPYWETRAVHLHTMHPLELTNLLNAWGVSGPQDQSGWESMLPYWSRYLEWMMAHKQNEVEWMLLWTPTAGNFNQSPLRQSRLQRLTQVGKSWGLDIGVVTPIRFVQQNGWTLLRNQNTRTGQPNAEQANIHEILTNLDWILNCGFTSVGGELGEGEFSAAPPQDTLQELNSIAAHLNSRTPPVPYRVKVHVSQKQFAKGYRDPGTGHDINFNYLPLYADSKVGVMPHTVQIYSLNDPAPTYDTDSFMDMFRFIKMAASGSVGGKKREVLFYPETAYWVSYDVDVPLFLPVYPYRRVQDLRMIAQDEINGDMKKKNAHINGQVIFSSGWEWGYWLNDVVTAEAAWNPHIQAANSLTAFRDIVADALRVPRNNPVVTSLAQAAEHQHKLLVQGKTGNLPPTTIEKRSGIAYMASVDSFDEIAMWTRENLPGSLGGKVPLTQPDKFRDDWAFKYNHLLYLPEIKYNLELKPLLQAMKTTFNSDANSFQNLVRTNDQPRLTGEFQEMADGLKIDALRADFVFNIYETRRARSHSASTAEMQAHYNNLSALISQALQITNRRKSLSPVLPQHRPLITAWESNDYKNPTDYRFGYVWSAYNLFYWMREFNKIRYVNDEAATLCYMNIVDPSEVEGKKDSPLQYIERFAQMTPYMHKCAEIPSHEPDVNRGW